MPSWDWPSSPTNCLGILEENGSDRSRATIGKAQILPGAVNTVPGMVEFSLDVRDTSDAVLGRTCRSDSQGVVGPSPDGGT